MGTNEGDQGLDNKRETHGLTKFYKKFLYCILSLSRTWTTSEETEIFLLKIFLKALCDASDAFRQMADIKYQLEDTVKHNFLDPITDFQNNELKDFNVKRIFFIFD